MSLETKAWEEKCELALKVYQRDEIAGNYRIDGVLEQFVTDVAHNKLVQPSLIAHISLSDLLRKT